MTPKKWLVMASLAAGLAGLGLWALSPSTGPAVDTNGKVTHRDGVASWFSQGNVPGQATSEATPTADGASAPDHQKPASPLDTMTLPTFRATDKGTLVMDQQTRQDVERIQALFPRDEALARLDIQASTLPAQAQRELKALYQQYSQYAQAVAQTYPPGLSEGTLDEAAAQLKGLHELRQQYFGAEGAEALFGQEEKTSQALLELMRKQTDPKLSLQEKAELAQAEWQQQQAASKP